MNSWVALLLIAVLLAAMLGFLALHALRGRREQRRARRNAEGVQEADVRVENGYHPAVVVVEAGSPVRLNFVRAEDAPCSARVIFGGLGLERGLPAHTTTPVEFVPTEPGEYLFTCELGMYQGWVRVEPEPRRKAARPVTRARLVDGSAEPGPASARPANEPGCPVGPSRAEVADAQVVAGNSAIAVG